MTLQALDPIREEEGGRVLWRCASSDSRFLSVPRKGAEPFSTISVRRSRPETGAAEFVRATDWLCPPRPLEAQLHGKYVRGKDFHVRASWWGEHFASTYPIFLGSELKRRVNSRKFRHSSPKIIGGISFVALEAPNTSLWHYDQYSFARTGTEKHKRNSTDVLLCHSKKHKNAP